MEITAFLADLDERREQLLGIVDAQPLAVAPGEPAAADLPDLARNLLLADEELRVQHEELEEMSARLMVAAAENESWFAASPHACVVTDLNGVVLRSNRVADELTQRPAYRTARPVVTWFQVSDRPRIRNLIGRMRTEAAARFPGPVTDEAVLSVPDGAPRPVVVLVTAALDPQTGAPLLRWELSPVEGTDPAHEPRLRLVGDGRPDGSPAEPAAPSPGEGYLALAHSLAELTADLAGRDTEETVLSGILDGALTLVPGAERAAVTLSERHTRRVAAWSDDTVLACEQAQLEPGSGPAPEALAGQRTITCDFPDDLETWPALGTVMMRMGIRRLICLPISQGERHLGTLTLAAARPDAFGPGAGAVGELVATHAAVALARIDRQHHLRAAVTTRQRIGEAVGILIERHRITADEAFRQLVMISNARNVKVRDLADLVVETGQDPADIRI